MRTVAVRKGKIPRFRSDQEERDFWARHSVEEFAGKLEDLDITIRPPRTEQIAVRLYKEDLQALRSLAAVRGVRPEHPAQNIGLMTYSTAAWSASGRAQVGHTGLRASSPASTCGRTLGRRPNAPSRRECGRATWAREDLAAPPGYGLPSGWRVG
jgi:CopG antitoxin of type II toxin-antitoxin system